MTETMQSLHIAPKIETKLFHALDKVLSLSQVASQVSSPMHTPATLAFQQFLLRDGTQALISSISSFNFLTNSPLLGDIQSLLP